MSKMTEIGERDVELVQRAITWHDDRIKELEAKIRELEAQIEAKDKMIKELEEYNSALMSEIKVHEKQFPTKWEHCQ